MDKIIDIELSPKKEQLFKGLDEAYQIISSEINSNHKLLIRDDFDFFKSKGRFLVHKTFAGGIIFLREPETIVGIKIDFRTDKNNALVLVEYSSEIRNKRNTKYKPTAGKIESTGWNMLGVLPNFDKYEKEIKIALMILIGKFVKIICEDLNQHSWFMKYENDFDIEMILDNERILVFPVKAV